MTTEPQQTAVKTHQPCPECSSSDALSIYEDGHSYCFSCGIYLPPEGGVPQGDSFEYLPWRGVTKETMAFYEVKTQIDGQGKPKAIGFKYPNGNHKIRTLDEKHFFTQKGKPVEGLFGSQKFAAGGHKSITITEGEIDALSLYQVLRSPVVSVQSSSTAVRDCTAARSWLNQYERIYLAFDADPPGQDAVRGVSQLFDYGKVYVVKFSNRKDANEYLVAGETEQLKNLWWNAKRYLPDEIKASFEDFREVLSKPIKAGIPYPFKALTDMTYGIRTGETVLITAQEKVGKTELMHFIEHQLLKETNDNVGAIFLEEPQARHLQALAGIELKRPCHLPDCGVSSGDIIRAVEQVVRTDGRLHLYTHFGSSDPDVLLEAVRFLVSARGCRYVLFDHLSIVVSGSSGEGDERRALDYLSTRLEMMCKELDFGLIMVSHVNDNGQTRGSRNPTKVADITVGAFRDLQATDPVERSTIHLKVLYNRFCGRTGPAGKIIFDPNTYSFREQEYDNSFSQHLASMESPPTVPGFETQRISTSA